MFCHKCGHKVSDDAVFCSKCGEKLEGISGSQNTGVSAKDLEQQKTKGITKRKTLWMILIGAVFLCIVLIAISLMSGGDDKKTAAPTASEISEEVASVIDTELDPNTLTSSETVRELLYGEQPIIGLMRKTQDEIRDTLGEPTDGTPVTGELLFGGTEYYAYGGISLWFDTQGYVDNIFAGSEYITANGVSLNITKAEIIELLGSPDYEKQPTADEGGEGFGTNYAIQYLWEDNTYLLSIEFADTASEASSIHVFLAPEDVAVDGSNEDTILLSGPKTAGEAETIFCDWANMNMVSCPEYTLLDEHYVSPNGRDGYLYSILAEGGFASELVIYKDDGSMVMHHEYGEYSPSRWLDLYIAFYAQIDAKLSGTDMLDPNLIGRWRAEDGGCLEFDEFGCILSCNFTCWNITDYGRKNNGAPDRLRWEASNGRVTCYSEFDYNDPYQFTTSYAENGVTDLHEDYEILIVGIKSALSAQYIRDDDTPEGSGLVGKWVVDGMPIWGYQFNSDGTGVYNGRFNFVWSTSQTDTNENRIKYTLFDTASFDYYVSGDILTVFLSDGSITYTRVGY